MVTELRSCAGFGSFHLLVSPHWYLISKKQLDTIEFYFRHQATHPLDRVCTVYGETEQARCSNTSPVRSFARPPCSGYVANFREVSELFRSLNAWSSKYNRVPVYSEMAKTKKRVKRVWLGTCMLKDCPNEWNEE